MTTHANSADQEMGKISSRKRNAFAGLFVTEKSQDAQGSIVNFKMVVNPAGVDSLV